MLHFHPWRKYGESTPALTDTFPPLLIQHMLPNLWWQTQFKGWLADQRKANTSPIAIAPDPGNRVRVSCFQVYKLNPSFSLSVSGMVTFHSRQVISTVCLLLATFSHGNHGQFFPFRFVSLNIGKPERCVIDNVCIANKWLLMSDQLHRRHPVVC